MGKRKKSSKKPMGPKKREPLTTTFTCLFCNHEKAINVKIDKKAGLGNLHCKVCGQRFQTTVNHLSAAVDVYADWVDACEEVAQEAAAAEAEDRAEEKAAERRLSTAASRRRAVEDDDDEDELLAEKDYEDE